MVVKDGFSNIATVVGNKTSTKTNAPLSDTRAVYNLIGGEEYEFKSFLKGMPEQNAGPAEPSTAKHS